MADSLRLDGGAVRAAGSQAGAAAATATPGSAQVAPFAGDAVSAAASNGFGARIALARQYTATANALAQHYGVKLDATAEAYDRQEASSAALLGAGPAGPADVGAVPDALGALADAAAPSSLAGAVPVSGTAVGEVPASPRDIARLIDMGRGGAGKQAWQAAELALQREARQLDDAADQIGAAVRAVSAGWQSSSADAAATQMGVLQSWYSGHADYVRGLAVEAGDHVQNFSAAMTSIPSYRDVLAGERELRNAVQANAMSGGAHRAAVVHAQVKVGGLYAASAAGFSSYTTSEALPSPQMPTPPPQPAADVPDASSIAGAGEGKIGTLNPQHSPTSAPVAPVQQGSGAGQDLSAGPAFPPGAVDPAAAAADPLVEAVPDTAGSLLPEVVPGVIGGLVGGLGGALGGLAGAGQRAVQSMQQAAAPLMSELGQHPQGGEQPQEGDQSSPPEPSGEPPSGGDLSTPDGDGGGGGGGEMEPAGGGAEPMAPPPDAVPTPAAAAPAAASAPVEPAPAGGTGMGPMMMPPMGTGRGGGSGPDAKQLYRDRKLKMVAPPNSEPVKNRRESRDKGGRDRKSS